MQQRPYDLQSLKYWYDFLIEMSLIYVLVSGVQQSDAVLYIYTHTYIF